MYSDIMTEAIMTEAPGRCRNLAPPPTFATAEEERRHRKVHLAGAFRLFARFGFDEGVAGHITVRDPERAGCFWVSTAVRSVFCAAAWALVVSALAFSTATMALLSRSRP